jgi:hypothetical protein
MTPPGGGDVSPLEQLGQYCLWCKNPIVSSSPKRRWCSKRCRQTAWRSRCLARVTRDNLVSSVARGGDSNLIGRKSIKFVNWLFGLLGAAQNDTLDDMFPGSGIVTRCWNEFCRLGTEASLPSPGDIHDEA